MTAHYHFDSIVSSAFVKKLHLVGIFYLTATILNGQFGSDDVLHARGQGGLVAGVPFAGADGRVDGQADRPRPDAAAVALEQAKGAVDGQGHDGGSRTRSQFEAPFLETLQGA